MTRETKIGLLVGLGFIVVFAILLSQSNPATSPVGGLSPVAARGSGRLTDPSTGVPAGRSAPWVAPGESGGAGGGIGVAIGAAPSSAPEALAAGGVSEELPSPAGLGPTPIAGLVRADLSDDAVRSEVAAAVIRRVAPDTVREPEPTTPTDPPTASDEPDVLAAADPRQGTADPAPTRPQPPAKEHMVQKGETLGQIASQYYQTSKPRVVQFIMDSNKGKIRNVDSVVEGQKLLIPAELPADMFEAVASLDHGSIRSGVPTAPAKPGLPGRNTSGGTAQPGTGNARQTPERPAAPDRSAPPAPSPRLSTDEALGLALGGTPERAATPPQTPIRKAPRAASDGTLVAGQPRRAPEKPSTEVAVAEGFRIYEIQPKDTPSAIARRQLGSEQQWREIIKMNPGLDPMRMRPGAQIKLPRKSTLAPSAEKKRGAA